MHSTPDKLNTAIYDEYIRKKKKQQSLKCYSHLKLVQAVRKNEEETGKNKSYMYI